MARLRNILCLVVIVLAANWPYVYKEEQAEAIGARDILLSKPLPLRNDTIAGWPIKFYHSTVDSSGQETSTLSWSRLLCGILIWSSIPLSSWIYRRQVAKRQRRSSQSEAWCDSESQATQSPPNTTQHNDVRKIRFGLADIFLMTVLVACMLAYWGVTKQRGASERKLALEIRSQGGCAVLSTMLPPIARNFVPYFGSEPFARIGCVELKNPNEELVAKVVQLPYLQSLSITGGNYRVETLKPLSTSPFLTQLAIVGRTLDLDAISTIRSFRGIRSLNLMRTNITAAGVLAIGTPLLEELNLIHTDVRLSELGKPSFSENLRVLRLPCPAKGIGDSLELNAWPNLIELTCHEHDELLNEEPVSLTLTNLPKLQLIELDALQRFDLNVDNLSNLKRIAPTWNQWERRTSISQTVPSAVWLRRLKMSRVPQLGVFEYFPSGTESIAVNSPNTNLSLSLLDHGAQRRANAQVLASRQYQTSRSTVTIVNGTTPITVPTQVITDQLRFSGQVQGDAMARSALPVFETSPLTCQQWIDDVSTNAIVPGLSLVGFPFQDISLQPLAKNKSIRSLVLDNSRISPDQLKDLANVKQLEELSLMGVPVDGNTIETLTSSLPKLRHLVCDPTSVHHLRVENAANLESVFIRSPKSPQPVSSDLISQLQKQLVPLKSLVIVNSPKLKDNFICHNSLQHLHIENATSIQGLSFHQPLPSNAIVKDLRDLLFFAAGGETCTDAIVEEVLKCKKLKSLTLAYTTHLPETLASIASLEELESLTLTGSKIDNRFINALSSLPKLKSLRLGNTSLQQIDVATICKLKSLEVLECGDWNLSPDDIVSIAENNRLLTQLSIPSARLSPACCSAVLSLPGLSRLDLSGCDIGDDIVKALVGTKKKNVIELRLMPDSVAEDGIIKLQGAFPRLLIVSEQAASRFGGLAGWISQSTRELFEVDPMRFSPNAPKPIEFIPPPSAPNFYNPR